MQDANDTHPPVLEFSEEDDVLPGGITFNCGSYIIKMPTQSLRFLRQLATVCKEVVIVCVCLTR